MSWALFRANIRSTRTIWIIMTAVYLMYFSIMTSMFDPESAQAFEDMLKALPEGMLKAFGMDQIGTTLLDMLASYMYGFLLFLFPMVITIVVNHNLIASHVDKGSMAYLLATPNSRKKIALTQALYSMASATLFFTTITIGGTLIAHVIHPGALDIGQFLLVNVYSLILYFTLGGIGFFASCLANESKLSLGIGIGLPVTFLVLQMLGDASDKLSWIGNLSLYALFAPTRLMAGEAFAYLGMAVLLVLAGALYYGGITVFTKKDLHV